ncbi:DUF5011 domain-containing protein [Rhodocytophaga rosea]|uniref:DUF5011 domain-containing protein n=1 Tax=Rhodocytophaga rosea TaxID=2704465 RepID=A0A6C0GDJ1_9BACT|nr:DUF5011 domain-containing protein [Rhodocytophaga rosea]QHT65987.1 DUF5011 domain-containing protein [Rhodocytophaga rosea]
MLVTLFWSCEKELDTEGLSRITTFADIQVTGDELAIVTLGQPYTDPGATAVENGKSVTVTTEGEVDVNTAGIYTITYSATNSDGFPNEASRLVAVLPPLPDEVKNMDLSGQYVRTGNFATVEKLADGLYYMTNVGGLAAPSPIVGVYFLHTGPTTIDVPHQPTSVGGLQCLSETLSPDGNSFSWRVVEDQLTYFNASSIRAFSKVKQPTIRYE